jgi:hypothetical protein
MNPDRKFIFVEMACPFLEIVAPYGADFSRWWYQQTDDIQKTVRDLVQ